MREKNIQPKIYGDVKIEIAGASSLVGSLPARGSGPARDEMIRVNTELGSARPGSPHTRSARSQTADKNWSNRGRTVIKNWSNRGQTAVGGGQRRPKAGGRASPAAASAAAAAVPKRPALSPHPPWSPAPRAPPQAEPSHPQAESGHSQTEFGHRQTEFGHRQTEVHLRSKPIPEVLFAVYSQIGCVFS